MALPRTGVGLRQGDVLVVIHDFNARTSDELTLRKSERVELIELDDGFGDGWYLGRHLTQGGTGLFPGVYTTKAPSSARPVYSHPGNRGSFSSHQAVTTSPDATPTSPPQQPLQPVRNNDKPSHSYSHSRDSTRSSLPPASSYTPYVPGVQRSIGETLSANDHGNEDSPVMNETLSVIDEHITDLSTPRQSVIPSPPIKEDSESEYSSHIDRQSYVAGPETDDEENEILTEAKVRKWDHKKTANHLRSLGVESKHCDIFEEQEISGDVLLDMDQEFIRMKDFDFGPMGRRLKTWHKIRDLQNEVKGYAAGRQSTISSVERNNSTDDISRSSSRVNSGSTLLPRIPSLSEKPGLYLRHSQPNSPIQEEPGAAPAPLQPSFTRTSLGANTPPSPWRASMIADGASRPSAAKVRELSHSRRHSSIDFSKHPDLGSVPYSATSTPTIHQKHGSMDRGWTMSGSMSATTTPQLPLEQTNSRHAALDLAHSPQAITPSDTDLDRGYFSGNEVDKRKQRSVLRKRDNEGVAAHSRQSSTNAAAMKKHARLSSVDSVKDYGPSGNSAAAKAYHSSSYKGRLRSASARSFNTRSLPGGTTPPTVTNLEQDATSNASRNTSSIASSSTLLSMQNKAKKLIGIRAASENLSQNEKAFPGRKDASLDGSSKASPVTSPTGSATPSVQSHSLEYENSDIARKAGEMAGYTALPRAPARNKAKGKQETSAYTRGLLKITPEEARKTCDYHGWMKKKSSSLMTTWKPRLFILKGRRLSYYYSENDTEERGIIDISGHKVLVANNDAIVTLHAQITGATSPLSNPSSAEPSPRTPGAGYASTIPFYYRKVDARKSDPLPSSDPDTPITSPASPNSATPFYFKLIPPKSGFSRAVQFTKPAVHYFQVDSLVNGRKWMGELMKATIQHDWSTLESTNRQKTISLAKAKARGERPKALLGDADGDANEDGDGDGDGDGDDGTEKTEIGDDTDENKENKEAGGLNISGLTFENKETPVPGNDGKNENKTDSGVGDIGDILAAPETDTSKTA